MGADGEVFGVLEEALAGRVLAEPVGEAGHGVEPAPVDGERAHAVEGRGLSIDGAGGRSGGTPGELVLADLVRGERGGPRGAAEERGEMGDPAAGGAVGPELPDVVVPEVGVAEIAQGRPLGAERARRRCRRAGGTGGGGRAGLVRGHGLGSSLVAATGRRRPSTFALVGATGKWHLRRRRRGESTGSAVAGGRAWAHEAPGGMAGRRLDDSSPIMRKWRTSGRGSRRSGSVNRSSPANCLGAQLAISVNNCPPPRDPRSRMTSFKRAQRKYVQKAYRVRNWREYETGLRARGSLTVWLGLTDGKLANWNSPRPTRRKPGRQRKYSNHAIETTVTLGLVFGLASRQTEGFLRSLLTLLNLDNDVPDHSTISRRKARLGQVASYERRTVKPVHLRIDSSGLSVHVGQLRTPPKARDYRKLHLAVDEHTSDVVACELTSKRARDASRVASLVGQIERPIASAKADAAYDTGDV